MPNPLRDPRDRRLPRIAGSCGLVMFGVTGDLARKKLMPAVYDLANRGLLPPAFALIQSGVSRPTPKISMLHGARRVTVVCTSLYSSNVAWPGLLSTRAWMAASLTSHRRGPRQVAGN